MDKALSVWLNGTLCFPEKARISPFDHGLTVGNGLFETLVARNGVPYALSRHYGRMCHGAEVLDLEVPDLEVLREAIDQVLEANGLADQKARVRITVTGGEAPMGSERGSGTPTVLVAAVAAPVHPETTEVAIVPHTRNESGALVGIKSTSYAENVIALAHAGKAGAGEAIFGNTQHHLCEGSGSNVFLVLDDHLVTPPLSSGCLPGITRELVLILCRNEGIVVDQKQVPLTALTGAQEAFLTSSTRDLQAIGAVDGVALAQAPGELTLELQRLFREWVAREVDP